MGRTPRGGIIYLHGLFAFGRDQRADYRANSGRQMVVTVQGSFNSDDVGAGYGDDPSQGPSGPASCSGTSTYHLSLASGSQPVLHSSAAHRLAAVGHPNGDPAEVLRIGGALQLSGWRRASEFSHLDLLGDGSTTTGTVQFAGIPIQGGLEWFVVEGSHTCRTRSVRRAQITVTKTGGVHATGTANVSVERWDPTAFFYFNPDNPTNGDIAMVVPHPPLPYQRPIDTYEWQFTDGNPVIDSPKTRPLYMRVLHALASDPGSLAAEGQAEVLGILPPGFSEGASVAQSVANVWLQYFPRHMVPHIYPDARNVRVTLTVTDSAGKKDTIAKDVHVSDHCLEWGGPLSFLFGNTNTCETWNGFQAWPAAQPGDPTTTHLI